MTTTKLRSTQSLYLLTTLLNFGSTPFFLVATSLTAAAFLVSSYHLIVSSVAYAAAPLFLFVTPTVTLLLCLGVVFLKHPVHNLLCLISVFFSTVVLYLYIGAEFLAFLFLIVYVGAIAILFLFVIMLLQLKVLVDLVLDRLGFSRSKPAAAIAVVTVLGLNDALATSLSRFLTSGDVAVFKTVATTTEELVWFVNSKFSDILMFSDLLYTYHCFLFFAAGLLLLTAMLGAIVLATSATDDNSSTPSQIFLSPSN